MWDRFLVDSLESAPLDCLLRDFETSTVFHLAGGASVPDSVQIPYRDFATSVPGTVKLLSEIIQYRPSAHVIFVSSAAVYGDPVSLPISEDAEVAPISPYGIHKVMSEYALQQYARIYQLKVSILRVFSVFGPGLRKQLFWDLARRASQALACGENRVILQGTGGESRDFIFASDVAKVALHISESHGSVGFETYNVGSGCETAIRDAAGLFFAQFSPGIEIVFDGEIRPGVPRNWCADVAKLRESGFAMGTSFEQGISLLAKWLKKEIGSNSQASY
jgi:nucleoside-diphosphate-sugar epimerase